MVADVEDTERGLAATRIGLVGVKAGVGLGGVIEHADHAFDDVVHIGEVTLHLAVVEHVDRPAFERGLGEQEQRHVRAPPGAIHGEEAQARGRQAEQVAVGVGHQLVGFLGGGVHADGVVHRIVLGERHLGVAAVDAGAAGVGQVRHLVVAAAFQDVHEADDVAVDIGMRVFDRVAHAGLGGEVDDAVEFFFGEELFDALAIGDIHLHEAEAGVRLQARQAVALELRVVVIIQIVEADHLVTPRQQALGGMHADKARRPGYQHLHRRSS